jgi:hypothetical protein
MLLGDKTLKGLKLRDCYFAPTSLELAHLEDCSFLGCKFAELRHFGSAKVSNVIFESCVVDSLKQAESREIWSPHEIQSQLENLGITIAGGGSPQTEPFPTEVDAEIRDIEKLARYFMRSTHMSESVMMMKLGDRRRTFIDDILPRLLKTGVLKEIENRGGGRQRRFQFGVRLQELDAAVAVARGSFAAFLKQFQEIE